MQNDRPEHAAVFYDGTSNRKRRIALRFAQQLELVENGVIIASWPYDDVRRADGHKTLRLSAISALPLARLDIEDETTARALRARCRSLDHGNGSGQTWRIAGWSLAAACSIVLMTHYGIPLAAARPAPLTPAPVEKPLGPAGAQHVSHNQGNSQRSAPEG